MTNRSEEPTLPPVHDVDPSDLTINEATRAPRAGSTLRIEPSLPPVSFLGPPRRPGDLGSLGTNCIESQIGKGGMGVVLRGWDTSLNRLVAVKVLRPELDVPEARERFIREAQAAAGLHHDHVIAVYGVFNPPDGIPYFTMELLLGPSLAQQLKNGPLKPQQAALLLAQVSLGVAAVHAAGLIHRDIKPANILSDADTGRVKLADFGLARDAAVPSSLTQDGTIVGTPHYLSPEQAAGRASEIDARTDVYALGVTLYEALTGSTPFRGTAYAVLRQVLEETPATPRRLNSDVPRDLEVICMKAMAREPSRRYASAAELHHDLQAWLEGRSISARPAGPAERALLWSRRNPLAVALMTVFLLGFVASVWGWWRAGVKAEEAATSALTAQARENDAINSANLATTRQQEAVAARKLADDKARLAEEHALIALGTINTLVFRAQQLADVTPGTLALKQQLAEAALADLRKLAASGDRVPGADRTRLAALRKLSETFVLLGRTEEAGAELEKAVTQASALGIESPSDAGLKRDLGTLLVLLAYIHRRGGHRDVAAEDLRRAIEALSTAGKLAPDDATIPRELAVAFNARGDVEQEVPSAQRAIADYQRALEIVERLDREEPNRLLYLSDLRFTHARLGLTHAIVLEFPAATEHYKKAETAAAKAIALEPTNKTARRDWHISLLDRADAQSRLGDYAGAEATARRAFFELAPIAGAEPDNAMAQRDLAIAHSLLGLALIGIDRPEAGQKELFRSLMLRVKIYDSANGSGLTASDIPVIVGLLVTNAERMGRFEECSKWCAQLSDFLKKSPVASDPAVVKSLAQLALAQEAYALAPKAIADPEFAKSKSPELARILLRLRASALARTGKPTAAIAAIDELYAADRNDFEVLVRRACIYSYCAGSGPDRAKRIDVALECLAEIARQRPAWLGDISYWPELLPARTNPAFAERVTAVVRSRKGM